MTRPGVPGAVVRTSVQHRMPRGLDLPLTRSIHSWRSTAALLVRAGFFVFWLPLDVYGFRSVLARGWHPQNQGFVKVGVTGCS
jgi:hypothetical protein